MSNGRPASVFNSKSCLGCIALSILVINFYLADYNVLNQSIIILSRPTVTTGIDLTKILGRQFWEEQNVVETEKCKDVLNLGRRPGCPHTERLQPCQCHQGMLF